MSILDRLVRRGGDVRAALRESAARCKAEFPDEAETIDAFAAALEREWKTNFSGTAREAGEPESAYVRLILSEDRMTLFACLFPPRDGGPALTAEQLREQLRQDGAVFGVQDDFLKENAENYFCIFPAAKGLPPRDGVDAALNELFERTEDRPVEAEEGAEIDYAPERPVQSVREGEAVCTLDPAVPGWDGRDVTGNAIPSHQAVERELCAGENTKVTGDGRRLIAQTDGIVCFRDGKFHVRPVALISGSVTTPRGSCKIRKSLVITGDAGGGVVVNAGGDIIIFGEVRDATVCSNGGSVRVQGGIAGQPGKTVVRAARQVQAPRIANAAVEAGGSVFAQSISDSEILSGASVFVQGEEGAVSGGQVQAMRLVQCARLGETSPVRVIVGRTLAEEAESERLQKESAEIEELLAALWKRIGELRRAGRFMNDEQKALLDRLVEQRALGERRAEELKARRKELSERRRAGNAGRVVCARLYPGTEVRIGPASMTFRQQEDNCNIRLMGEGLIVR